ncbi:hypothetical protein JCM11491_006000 [Sporobolomyces phaffii]
MPATPRIPIEIRPVTVEDLPAIAQGNIDTLTPFHDSMEHVPFLSDRVERQARRLARLLESPRVDFRKAVVSETGALCGVALWMYTPAGERPQNLKRRFVDDDLTGTSTPQDDEDEWKGVDWEKWNQCWDEWDAVRDGLVNRREHWYLVPLWVLPEFEGNGIGRALLDEKIQQCERTALEGGRTTPIYLEASKQGKPLYEKLGFRQYGESYYCEMIRWGHSGNDDDLARCERVKQDLLDKTGRTSF